METTLASFSTEIGTILRQGGPVLWVLLLWGAYLYYLLFATGWRVRHSSGCCRELDCLFAGKCGDWRTVDLSCRYLRQDMLALAEGRIRFLQMAVNAAPLLGLLGTVFGIFKTFDGLGQGVPGELAHSLSEGISEALLTTQLGLIIAIPSYVMLRGIVRGMEATNRRLTCFELECRRIWLHSTAQESAVPAKTRVREAAEV